MDEEAVERVVSILEDDAFRRGGSIKHDRLLQLATKHELGADAIVVVRQRLVARDVGIDDPDASALDAEVTEVNGDAARGAETEPGEEAVAATRDILAAYFRDAKKFKFLNAGEEMALARRIRVAQDARNQLEQNCEQPLRCELEAMVADGEAARQTLIEANLRLVPFVAKSIEPWGMTQEDLIQEGNLGLMRAVEKFDGAHGTRFSTYACWWIWSFIKRAVDDRGRLIRVPVHVLDRIPALLRTRKALSREKDGAVVTPQELAEHLSWRIETVHFVLQALDSAPVSIDARADDESFALGDRLSSPPEASPHVAAERKEERHLVNGLVESLGKRMAFIIRERFGIGSGIERTLEDIGAQLGVTRERIRQIEKKALEKLRHPSRLNFLRDLLGRERPRTEESDATEVALRSTEADTTDEESDATEVVPRNTEAETTDDDDD